MRPERAKTREACGRALTFVIADESVVWEHVNGGRDMDCVERLNDGSLSAPAARRRTRSRGRNAITSRTSWLRCIKMSEGKLLSRAKARRVARGSSARPSSQETRWPPSTNVLNAADSGSSPTSFTNADASA